MFHANSGNLIFKSVHRSNRNRLTSGHYQNLSDIVPHVEANSMVPYATTFAALGYDFNKTAFHSEHKMITN